MTDGLFLICAPADQPLMVPGTSFRHHCSRCSRRVMVSPTGQRRLRQEPVPTILCVPCCLENPQPIEPLTAEQHVELAGGWVPNRWRERN